MSASPPTPSQRKLLGAILDGGPVWLATGGARVRQFVGGRVRTFAAADAHAARRSGWLRQTGDKFELTDAGREAVRDEHLRMVREAGIDTDDDSDEVAP